MCIGCDEVLTIEHILLTCSDLMEIRERHLTGQSLRVLFQDIPPEKIFNLLKEISILGKEKKIVMTFGYVCELLIFFKSRFKIVHNILVLACSHF